MGYHDTLIGLPAASTSNADLRVTWASTSPPGTAFQVYLDRVLSWSGTKRSARFPRLDPAYVEVVAVDPGDERTDFSAAFADALPARRTTLEWSGGRWASETIEGYRVFMGPAPGAAVSYASPVGSVPWASNGIKQDGFGIGGFGNGGFGRSEVRYRWTSGILASGTWNFAVLPVDASGLFGTAATATRTIAAPPQAPRGLALSVSPSTRIPTLAWQA